MARQYQNNEERVTVIRMSSFLKIYSILLGKGGVGGLEDN